MKEIFMDEIKKIEIEILKDVARFCDENAIDYYLAGGTLLGAIRHQGFIPWDDDIDLIMPRKDYIKFFTTYKSNKRYYIADSIINNAQHWLQAGKIFDARTIVINQNEKMKSHVWIDVFLTDGVPKNKLLQYLHFWHTRLANYIYLSTVTTYSESLHFVDKVEGSGFLKQKIRTAGKFILMMCFGKIKPSIMLRYIDRQVSKYDLNTSNKIASQIACQYFTQEIVNKKNFLARIPVKFEGCTFWGPKGYDEYLANLYGKRYMELPPLDKRISRHDFKAYWKDTK